MKLSELILTQQKRSSARRRSSFLGSTSRRDPLDPQHPDHDVKEILSEVHRARQTPEDPSTGRHHDLFHSTTNGATTLPEKSGPWPSFSAPASPTIPVEDFLHEVPPSTLECRLRRA